VISRSQQLVGVPISDLSRVCLGRTELAPRPKQWYSSANGWVRNFGREYRYSATARSSERYLASAPEILVPIDLDLGAVRMQCAS
jgi:hypothetical protein